MKYYVKGLPGLEVNSDGDCQLMSTENFHKLRGYRESETINSPDADGLLEFCAYAAGVKDVVFDDDACMYKIEHGGSYKSRVLPSIIPFYNKTEKLVPNNFFGPQFIKFIRMTGLAKLFYNNRVTYVRGLPQPTRNQYYEVLRKIVDGEKSYKLNDENWGINNEKLDDHLVLRASWEKA